MHSAITPINSKMNYPYSASESQFPDQIEANNYNNNTSAHRGSSKSTNLWFSNFEIAQNYNIYFPHNNLDVIV